MAAAACLSRVDEALAGHAGSDPDALRRRGSFVVILEVLTQHADYFDAGAGMRFTKITCSMVRFPLGKP